MELRRLFKLISPKKADVISIPGYLKQRLKLNPWAFMTLSDFHISNFYAEEKELMKFKNHFVFAVDGSHFNLPNTKENETIYGFQVNQISHQGQAGISCLYDVLNKMILDCTINHYKFNERDQAEVHIAKIKTFIQDQPYILVLDRGYPSSFFFIERLEQDQKFIVRLSSSDFKQEQMNIATADEDVDIEFTKYESIITEKPPLPIDFGQKGSIRLRFVKVTLPGDTVETLATNLAREEFSVQEIRELYGLRWGIMLISA